MKYTANKILFPITPVKLSTQSEFEAIDKSQLLIYSHYLQKFLKETLHFSGCWFFLKNWNNEDVVINITSPHRDLCPPTSPHKHMKKFCPHKILTNFKLSPPITGFPIVGWGHGGAAPSPSNNFFRTSPPPSKPTPPMGHHPHLKNNPNPHWNEKHPSMKWFPRKSTINNNVTSS